MIKIILYNVFIFIFFKIHTRNLIMIRLFISLFANLANKSVVAREGDIHKR